MARVATARFRPGRALVPGAGFRRLAFVTRLALLVFVLHLSGAAHLLADVLLDDDMTCVDELARKAHPDSAPPRCPTAQGLGHGHGFAPAAAGAVLLPPPECVEIAGAFAADATLPMVLPPSIERPPRV